jgi:hypothetical protein
MTELLSLNLYDETARNINPHIVIGATYISLLPSISAVQVRLAHRLQNGVRNGW